MSVTVTTDVFCDGCGVWIHGCVGPRPEHRAARRVAKAHGWKYQRSSTRKMVDLCPRCAGTKNGGEE